MSAFFGTSILRDDVCLALESDFSIVGGMSLSLVSLQDAIRRNMADNTPLEPFGPMRRPFLQA